MLQNKTNIVKGEQFEANKKSTVRETEVKKKLNQLSAIRNDHEVVTRPGSGRTRNCFSIPGSSKIFFFSPNC